MSVFLWIVVVIIGFFLCLRIGRGFVAKGHGRIVSYAAGAAAWFLVSVIGLLVIIPSPEKAAEPATTKTQPAQQSQTATPIEQTTAVSSTSPSHQELINAAKQYVGDVGHAIDAVKQLKNIDLKTAHDTSVNFRILSDNAGRFGQSDMDEPLGHCFAMGTMANAWWHAQLSASKEPEKYADSVKGTAASYNEERKECLAQINKLVKI